MEDDYACILTALRKGDRNEALRLIYAKQGIGYRDILSGYSLIHLSAAAGNYEIVKALIYVGCDPLDDMNTVNQTPLEKAVFYGYEHITELLIQAIVDSDRQVPWDKIDKILEEEYCSKNTVRTLNKLRKQITEQASDSPIE